MNVVDGEESRLALEGSLKPVLVHFVFESDHVSLPEAELPRVLRLEVVERLAGGRVQRGRGGAGRVAVGGGHAGVEARAELRRMMGRRASRRYQVTAGDVALDSVTQPGVVVIAGPALSGCRRRIREDCPARPRLTSRGWRGAG